MIIASEELISKIGSKEVLRNVNLLINGKKIENSDIVININGNDYCLELINSNRSNLLCILEDGYKLIVD